MEWVYVIIAGCFEVIGFIFVKRMSIRDTWTNNLLLLGAFGVSLCLLSSALESIPLGVAYSVWTGIGTIGTALVGMFFFKERATPLRLVCIAGIVGTVIGLRLTV
ncbi:QacE family quaternary ammonium compound efflux SMR transporter [Paenibacillus dendritiformis]|uniref:DMT family transporter n=1 Tax=Paenibacillus dendritiformis TaxID=130049 RepID=UPI00143DEF1D|nr:multidrug efflux SMR transporter [Paenibacillus dendritiformis]NKI22190.1 multidrug efflux SMR transporter [Paenibacillus dendritiformis]NRG00747.1 multidrug efflux SMR transporter [Paenibacillus dendritiformis]GIO72761.1 QacE family quaternary ammonium compound efflux SMR transporter [Paenibacillus dendritiformis]